jgi:phage terminase large subunit
MTTAQIKLPQKLIPVFAGEADVRGAYGGRGSAKTRSFAKMTAVRGYMWSQAGREGILLCGRQYQNSLDESSLSEVRAAIRSEPWLAAHYELGDKYIRTRDGRVEYKFAGLDRNIESVKSKAKILLTWVDEAEPVTEEAWQILIPTLREEDSELWVTWNPRRKGSATSRRFRETKDPRTKVVELNWRDNPCFPDILERARLKDKLERPDSYDHVWEGGYETIVTGAYYAQGLTAAKAEGRISRLAADPLMTIRLFMDIGGTSAKSDAFTIWAAQFIGKEIRVLDYYEAVGQPIGAHIDWMRSRGYTPDRAAIWLPHDGATQDRIYDVSYESAFRAAGYTVTVVPNQGKGAAKARIEAARRWFPAIWFNEATTEGGRDALGWYHERHHEERNIGLGPEHDWASHGADSFGLMCVVYEPPRLVRPKETSLKDKYRRMARRSRTTAMAA